MIIFIMDESKRLENRLKLIHNKTACEILENISEIKKETGIFTLNEIRNKTKLSESTLLINLKLLIDHAFLIRSSRGAYEFTFEGKNVLNIIKELESKSYLDFLRRFKSTEKVIFPFFSSKRLYSVKDLENNISRASSYRIFKILADEGYLLKNINKTWSLSKKFETLIHIILQKKELSDEMINIIEEIKHEIKNQGFKGITIVIGSVEGFLIFPDIDEDHKFTKISASASAEVNIADKLSSDLKIIMNILAKNKGFSIIRKYDNINFICEIKNSTKTENMLKIIPFIDKKMELLSANLI